jgi:ABC-2 type transport system permease protein
MVRRNHLNNLPPNVAQRILDGSDLRVQPLNSERTFGGDPEAADFLPLGTALIFSFMIVTTSSYMLASLATEKENRTMEIVLSSISAGKLMTGKIIGALGIAGVQLVIYALTLLAGLLIGKATGVTWLQDIHPRWQDIIQIIIVAIPAYCFLAATFTTIGATLVESTEAQQIGPFAFLLLLLPIYVMPAIIENPNGPLSLIFSFFPPTAMVTFALRLLLSAVSWWHVLISATISLLSAAAMTRLAAKAFRLSMLRYGQRLNLRSLFRRQAHQS